MTKLVTDVHARLNLLDAVSERDLPTTTEVAEAVRCKYRTAYERLGRLNEAGRLNRREIGSSLVWTATETEAEG